MRTPWGWHDIVETCRSVAIYEFIIIVLLLVNLQNIKKMHGTGIKMKNILELVMTFVLHMWTSSTPVLYIYRDVNTHKVYYKQIVQQLCNLPAFIGDYWNMFRPFLIAILRGHWYAENIYGVLLTPYISFVLNEGGY